MFQKCREELPSSHHRLLCVLQCSSSWLFCQKVDFSRFSTKKKLWPFFWSKRGPVNQPLNVCLLRGKCRSRMNGNHSSHEVVTSSSCSFNSNNHTKMPRNPRNREMVGGCCVCSDERGWDENPLVYCDGQGCNVAVHQGKIRFFFSTKFDEKIGFLQAFLLEKMTFWLLA